METLMVGRSLQYWNHDHSDTEGQDGDGYHITNEGIQTGSVQESLIHIGLDGEEKEVESPS